ncbi:MAG: LysE family translocator [Muribaculaceae bacterium]|nr:LysE family translocator [Muribaculaceae bacterium]
MEDLFNMILHGLLIGIVVSAPMGPVGIFCIQRTLDRGRLSGFYTGVGAAVSDLIYCLLTGFGLSFIEGFINSHRAPIQLFGASVLIGFGIWLIRKKPHTQVECDAEPDIPSPRSDILKGFALTFSNPLILFLIIGLFAQFNFVIEGMKFYHYMIGFLGIIAGALGWWWIVTYFVDKIRGHFTQRTMKLINTIVGIIILIFAAVGIFSSVKVYAAPVPEPVVASGIRGGMTSFRVEDKALKGWTALLADSAGSGFLMKVTPEACSDLFGDRDVDMLNVEVTDALTGGVLASAQLKEGIDPYRGKNSWRIARGDGFWRIFAGNRNYTQVAMFHDSGFNVAGPLIEAMPGGGICISCLVSEFGRGHHDLAMREDVSEFLEAGDRPKTSAAGVYMILDYELDDSYAEIGGAYRVAVMPSLTSSGFDMVYVSGAGVLPGRWIPGMVKARLLATPFTNIYDVHWSDAEGKVMERDIHSDFDPLTQILTIRFPYQNAVMRFRKE